MTGAYEACSHFQASHSGVKQTPLSNSLLSLSRIPEIISVRLFCRFWVSRP